MIISDNTYMRGEPLTAIFTSLSIGIYPASKRRISPVKYHTHAPNYVSIGKGNIKTNPAFMKEFFDSDSVIYVISQAIETIAGFRPNSPHPQSSEYLVKKIPVTLITGIITHEFNLDKTIYNVQAVIDNNNSYIKTHLEKLQIATLNQHQTITIHEQLVHLNN